MAASVEYRNVMKEKEDDLSLFLELRNREMGRNDLSLLQNSEEFDDSLVSKPKITATMRGQKEQTDEFLDSENDKTDYDWLLAPPCTPPFPSLEKSVMKANGNSKSQTTASRSRLAEPPVVPASRSDIKSSRWAASSAGVRSSSAGIRRPSSSGGAGSIASRPATPTGRPTLPAIAKPLRSSTPTSRAAVPSNKATTPPKRSSTPSNARSSTPTARPSVLAASKSTSRTATPTRRPSSSSSMPTASASAPAGRSSSVTKSGGTTNKNPVPSRGTSPTVKSRPLTSLSGRPASASRERPSAPSARPSSIETSSSGRPRQKPCSPLKGRVSSGNPQISGRPVVVKSRKYSNSNDEVNPVLMGTQMVERVVNMRKLAPPKQDDPNSNHTNSSGKSSSSQDSSGFGRSLSKKSLEMAMRHMDIRRSISGHMRTLMKDVPASSVYSVRSESTKLRTTGGSYSGLATSSDDSSERSVNNNSRGLDGSEVDYIDLGSEGGRSSPRSQQELPCNALTNTRS